jgi:pilus assembly protein CpaB
LKRLCIKQETTTIMTWLLRGLALALAIGAVVAAVVGYRLSTQPMSAKPAPPAETVVQAARALRAGDPIGQADLAVTTVPTRPTGSFANPGLVVGQTPAVDVPAGEILNRSHFQTSGRLSRSVRAGERAVAVKVDEVAGLAGFAEPGDRVDVLFHVRGSKETANSTSAQVVLANVRLLAYGEMVQQAPSGSESPLPRTAEKPASRASSHSSAVLAVPEAAAARLMLAANSGNLRLSLRPAADSAGADASADQNHLVRLAELAQAKRPAPRPAPARTTARTVAAAAPAAATIVVHEGDAVRAVSVPSR